MADPVPRLAFERVSRDFPGVRALTNVSFGVRAGTIHGLMGENGAGKSTLLKILSGALLPTGGELRLDGAAQRFSTTAAALDAGIAVIYQELHLVPELSVAENLFLGHLPSRYGMLDRSLLRQAAQAQLAAIGEALDPWTKVGRLSIAQRQMVEVAKALTRGARILAFDEPTSSLSAREVERLFGIIRGLRARDCAILYVSHRMDEIFELCDHVTVLRDGCHVQTAAREELSRESVVRLMVGRDVADIYSYRPRAFQGSGIEVTDLSGPGLAAPLSFQAQAGEILALFGLVGAGRTEALRLIAGIVPKLGGRVRMGGRDLDLKTPRQAIEAGIVLCPEDRKKEGIVPVRSVLENINLSARRRHARAGQLIDEAWERANARQQVERLHVKTPSLEQPVRNLSGGNQQKVILGRWLSEDVRVLLLDEPTRGIDVGAKSEIYAIMQALAERGVCVVMVSSDLPEVLGVADRIGVMRQGRLAAVVSRADATETSLLQLALPMEAA